MPYPEQLIKVMREDLTQYGIAETKSPEEVTSSARPRERNRDDGRQSVCGCAAGKARPGIALACRTDSAGQSSHGVRGADIDGSRPLRELAPDAPPSSPSVYLFRDGKPVYLLQRHQIENRTAADIAEKS